MPYAKSLISWERQRRGHLSRRRRHHMANKSPAFCCALKTTERLKHRCAWKCCSWSTQHHRRLGRRAACQGEAMPV